MPTPEDLAVGALLELRGEAIDADGSGVVEHAGRQIHVPGLLPDELARVRIDNLARFSANAYGHLLGLLEPHPQRRAPPCPQHRDPLDRSGRGGTCGGCPLMHLEIAAQREAKRDRLRGLGLDLGEGDLIGGDEWGYRWSSKRVVAGKLGALWLGSRRADPLAHAGQIADMRGCRVDHPVIERVFEALVGLANAERIQGWRPGQQDKPATGDLRYAWAKTDGERVLLTLITSPGDKSSQPPAAEKQAEHSRAAELLPAQLMAKLPELAGVAWSVQPERGNAIRGRAPELLAGVGTLTLELAGVRVEVGPLGFLQPNPPMAAKAYLDLVDVGQPVERVWDLYAGIGVTTALLRARHGEVIACESYAESAQALGIAPMAVEDFVLARKAERPDLIVANPPRAGLGTVVCERLLEVAAPRVHMMSCNPETLADDLARLGSAYELERLRGYDTLPQTAHLELVACLRRR